MHRLKRERCLPVSAPCLVLGKDHVMMPLCLSGVRCHSRLTSLTCKMYLTGQEQQQRDDRVAAAHVCFCSSAPWPLGWPWSLKKKKRVGYLAPHPHSHHPPLAWSCVITEPSLFIRANLCCRETLCPIQRRTFSFQHHPSLSPIPSALKKDPGSLKRGRGPEPFKVYPMPRAQ